MEMEYGPFGIANLIVDAYGSFTAAWRVAEGGERFMWILLLAAFPAMAYAIWFMTGQRDRAFG